GKEHHIEEIGRTQFPDQVLEQSLRRVQREAFHRARDVDHEDVFTRRNRVGRNSLRWLGHVKKEILVAALEEQQARSNLIAGQTIAQDKISIALERIRVVESHLRNVLTLPLRQDLV